MTGMSGTGKSSALAALREQGFDVVDTDLPGWTEWSDEEAGYVEPLVRATCTHEIDATQPIDAVVAEVVAIGSDSSAYIRREVGRLGQCSEMTGRRALRSVSANIVSTSQAVVDVCGAR
jgi:hypothetical protein